MCALSLCASENEVFLFCFSQKDSKKSLKNNQRKGKLHMFKEELIFLQSNLVLKNHPERSGIAINR